MRSKRGLNVRSEPTPDGQIVEQILKNERYSILGQQDGWIQISDGYISSDYVDIRYALNEARKLDLRTMVLNLYDNLGISNVNNYLNIREEPTWLAFTPKNLRHSSTADSSRTLRKS